jgi:TRAP-type transport system small permease protein
MPDNAPWTRIALKFIGGIDFIVKSVIIISMAAMLVVICLQVFYRYGLGSALSWPEELAMFAMVWSSLLAATYVQLERGHLSLDFLVSRLPPKVTISIRILMNLLVIFFLAIVVYYGLLGAYGLKNLSTGALRISRAIPYMALPVSCGMLALATLSLILKDLIELARK